jgi:hypothetical protein
MKQARGTFCGSFSKPSTPFQAQPFSGTYSRGGGPSVPGTTQNGFGTGAPVPQPAPAPAPAPTQQPPPAPTPGPTAGTGAPTSTQQTGGQGFSPDSYESAPPAAAAGGTGAQ